MPQNINLTTTALVMSILSTTLSLIALWPHLKDRLSVVRDAVLWIAVLAFAGGLFLMFNDGQGVRPWLNPANESPKKEAFGSDPYDQGTGSTWRRDEHR